MSSVDYGLLTFEELRDILVNQYGYNPDDIEDREEAERLLGQEDNVTLENPFENNSNFSFGDEDEARVTDASLQEQDSGEEDVTINDPASPDWTKFLLSQLKDSELRDGYPKLNGLRRLLLRYSGRVVNSISQVIQTPEPANEYRATVTHTISVEAAFDGTTCSFSGSADAYGGNSEKGFDKHPVAVAETRAEARAIRRALRLDVVSAEEMQNSDETSVPEVLPTDEVISKQQINAIEIMCRNNERGMNINVQALLQANYLSYNKARLYDYPRETASEVIKLLGTYQQDTSKIPQHLIGYDANWRNQC